MKELRNLSGIYFRAKREGKWTSVCFEELTPEEQTKYLENKEKEWLKSMIIQLSQVLNELGEKFNISSG